MGEVQSEAGAVMADWLSGSRGLLSRAPRFPLQMRVRYRGEGEPSWHEGQTQNISRSGVLFSVEQLIPPRTPVELVLYLPDQFSRRPAAHIQCRGEVVRQVPAESPGVTPAVATKLHGYRFVPREADN